jgi:hypothetical protein
MAKGGRYRVIVEEHDHDDADDLVDYVVASHSRVLSTARETSRTPTLSAAAKHRRSPPRRVGRKWRSGSPHASAFGVTLLPYDGPGTR